MIHLPLILLALAFQPSVTPPPSEAASTSITEQSDTKQSESPRAFMDKLAANDATIESMTAEIRVTVIQMLESDRQQRFGNLYLSTDHAKGQRLYAARFHTLYLDNRASEIREHYIFDGRWFVERLPDQQQFNKRELAPLGQTLDPMELMREAPFWVSLGSNTDRVFESYDIKLQDPSQGLANNEDFPELAFLVDSVAKTTQLKLTPKPGSGFEDDWEWVRIWFSNDTLLPRLYVKADWTGDLQIVELPNVQTNIKPDPSFFDTTTPPPEAGWRVHISQWRGDANDPKPDSEPNRNPDPLNNNPDN